MSDQPQFSSEHDPQAIAEAERLWPVPWGAPETPSRSVVCAFLHDGLAQLSDQIEASDVQDLREQLRLSLNCQRAIAELLMKGEATKPLEADELNSLKKLFGEVSYRDSGWAVPTPRLGEIFTTTRRVKIFDGGYIKSRWTFDPPTVIIVQPPSSSDEHEVVRGVVCSPHPLDLEPGHANDEVLVKAQDGSQWVAHLWLEFPIHPDQLRTQIGRL